MRNTNLFLALPLILLLGACASAPRKFSAPSSAGVHAQIAETKKHIENANSDAAAAKSSIARAKVLAKGNDALLLELSAANSQIDSLTQSLLLATKASNDAETKLKDSDAKVQDLANTANKLAADNFKLSAFEKRMNGAFGLGAIAYGIGRLLKHLLILALVLVLIVVLLFVASFFFPVLAPVMGFLLSIWNRILSLFRKPPPA